MDGVLIDSEAAIRRAWIDAAATTGGELSPDDYLSIIGLTLSDAHSRLASLLGAERFAAARQLVLAEVGPESGFVFPAKPGAMEALATLAGLGVRCAVASSTAAPEVRRRLGAVDLLRYFEVVVGGDEVARGKPDPALFLLAARRLGAEPSACVVFEDSTHGLSAARAAGITAVAVPDLKEPDPALSDRRLDSLQELVPLAASWFAAGR